MNPTLLDDQLLLDEFGKFQKFCEEVIFPNQPQSFVSRSKFHNSLMLTACKKMSATAAPRGFLKSTTLARYRPLHRLCDQTSRPELNGMKPEVLILSETTRLSKEHLAWIKNELLTNKHLIAAHGHLADPSNLTWNEDEIVLKNGAKAIAVGYDSQIRGKHPTDIITDDLESLRNMSSEEGLSKLTDWFFRVLMGAMTPETSLTVIGTIIAKKSLLSELVEHPEFSSRVWKALEGDTEADYRSLWPERYPVSLLVKLRARLKTHRFNAEYQNSPLGLEDQIIWLEWIRRHTAEQLTQIKPVRRYITCDPAFTEERWGDYSAIIVMDEAPDGSLFERLAWRKKVNTPELRDTLMTIIRHHSDVPTRIGIEEVAAQKVLRQMIQEMDRSIEIIPMRPDKDKARRLIDVSRYFEMGLVSLKTESLIDELLQFPMGDKDRVDALVYALKLYEVDHPIILSPDRVTELNPLKDLDDTSLQLYAERFADGNPNYPMPKEIRQQFLDAMGINDIVEEYFL